jgi:hypothetical protein
MSTCHVVIGLQDISPFTRGPNGTNKFFIAICGAHYTLTYMIRRLHMPLECLLRVSWVLKPKLSMELQLHYLHL